MGVWRGFKYSLLPTSQRGEVTRPRGAHKSVVISVCYPDDISGSVQKLHAAAEASRQPQFISDALSSRFAAQRVCESTPEKLVAAASLHVSAGSGSHQTGLCGSAPPRGASACSLAAAAAAVLVSFGKVAAGVCGTGSALPISASVGARLRIWKEEKEKKRR